MTRLSPPAPAALRLRPLTPEDLPFADAVRALAGWNQTRADWERFLAAEPDGCFLAEWAGAPAGTATTTTHGPGLAWIGMVLVHPDYRRRGIGRALVVHCLDHLRARGVRCIKLDATPAGQAVYQPLGFRETGRIQRWWGRPVLPEPTPPDPRLRPLQATDIPSLASLDRAAFGLSRSRLLTALAAQSIAAWARDGEDAEPEGFGLLRPGAQALYLGPVVAASAAAGLSLVEALLAQHLGQVVCWDIPDLNRAAVDWARQHGLSPQRSLVRMAWGGDEVPEDPLRQFALAGPEVG